jgi:hypothetical protein
LRLFPKFDLLRGAFAGHDVASYAGRARPASILWPCGELALPR